MSTEPVFLRACRREPTPFTPVWLMRQAGRYMPEYRAVRERLGFLELCHNSEAAAEVTITAAELLGVDAAIIFADILLVLEPLGCGLEFTKGDGPTLRRPVRNAEDVARLRAYDVPDALAFVYEAIRLSKSGLAGKPLIGFAGAPFTLASYLIEGGGSRDYIHTKSLMYRSPDAWEALMGLLAQLVGRHLQAQITAGADAVQLFDSWVGCLAPADYVRFVQPHTRAALAGLPSHLPVIHFGTGTAGLLSPISQCGASVIGVDWRIGLDSAWGLIGENLSIQGNLDPVTLFAEPTEIRRAVADILARAANRPGHVFNLGHGILPETPVENVRLLVDTVHELSSR